ncbi:hypothetical protein, partial [Thiolapillus sp.]|uniref:hypothetical protein n=1 Tax=Thiolapillus sp. TaxID=2017437 RepID=UPI003AF9BB32
CPSQNLHPNNSPDLFKSDTGDDRLPQNPVGGGVGEYDKVELSASEKIDYPKSGADYGPRMF